MAFHVKTPLLGLVTDLSMQVMRNPGFIGLKDAAKLSSFLDVLTRYVGEAAIGRASPKRTDALLRKWGNLPLHLQHRVVSAAEAKACLKALEDCLGPLPEPEATPEVRRYEPMF